jgi:hypothetical protein
VVTLVNLIFLLFGMLSTAGLGRHSLQLAGNPMKHTSSLGLHEILEKVVCTQSMRVKISQCCFAVHENVCGLLPETFI